MQAMHGRLSDPGSYEALQHFITDSPWEAGPLWTRLRTLVPSRQGILAVDDTSFPKQGHHSVGVQRQYCGALGKIANCQVAVSTVLLDDHVAWPLSFELYLPQAWCTDAARRTKARIPATVRFREKWRIALTHIRQVLKAGFHDHGGGDRRRLRGAHGVSAGARALGVALRHRAAAHRGVVDRRRPTHPHGGGDRRRAARGRLAPRHVGRRHQRSLGRALRGRARPAREESRRPLVAVRTLAGRRRAEILLAESRRHGLAPRLGDRRAQPLADRAAVSGAQR